MNTVVYLHGLVADVHATRRPGDWPPFLTALAADRAVEAPPLPGWPDGEPLDRFDSVDDYAFHFCDVLDGLSLDAVDLVGSSFGAWLAAEFALRHPSRVRRLVLLAPLGLHVPDVDVPPFFGAVAPRGVGGFGEARDLLFADPSGAVANESLPDDMDREHQLRWFAGLTGAARLGWQWPHFQSRSFTKHAWRMTVPTVLVFGSCDRLVPRAHVDSWRNAVKAADVHVVDGAGHALTAERPDEVAAIVLRFFGGE